jgi:predicted nucleotidyltransferase
LNFFVESNILKIDKRNRFLFYKLNKNNVLFKEYLIMCEKERLFSYLEKNTLFLMLYNKLCPFFDNSIVVIFGSSIVLDDFSDIDVLILSDDKKIKNELNSVLNDFELIYSVKIHAVKTNLNSLTNTFLEEIKKTYYF